MSTILFSQNARCICNGVYIMNPPGGGGGGVTPCSDDCLQIASISVPCLDGMVLDGGEYFIPISAHNNYTACPDGHTITILSYNEDFIDSIGINENGDIQFVTNVIPGADPLLFPQHTNILYKVSCNSSILSSNGNISICVKLPE